MDAKLCTALAAALVAAVTIIGPVHAAPPEERSATRAPQEHLRTRGWTLHLDNDAFTFGNRDGDYTAGLSVTFGGGDAAGPKPLTQVLDFIDDHVRFGMKRPDDETIRSFEAGVVLFTPQDLEAQAPVAGDRPYANLAYLSSSRLSYLPGHPVAHQSSLTVGVLGMPWVAPLHRSVHAAFGSRDLNGYAHQISNGGEPTVRYAVSRYRLLDHGTYKARPYHLRLGLSASVGYLTEASADFALRWGTLDTPWWSSSPLVADYAGHPPIRLAAGERTSPGLRFQLSAGVNVRLRVYNAFLQGQFRDSDVTYAPSRLNRVLVEAWLGVSTVLRNDLSISYTLRRQTEELRTGGGARAFSWASIGIAKQF